MKTIILLILVYLIANNYQVISQDILWKKNYGLSNADDFGQSVIEANDGNIVLVGYTASFGAGGNDIWLIKTTPDGDTLWTKTYGESGEDFGYQVKQTEDNGFIIAGATESFGSAGGLDFCLIKTDEDGNKLWVKTFGFQNDDMAYSLELTFDGGYILAGEKDAYPEADSDVWIVKTDSSGQIQWEKSYGIEIEDERAYTIKQTSDGGYISGGQKGCSGFSNCDAWLLKLNSFGDTLWTKKIVTPNWSSSFHSIILVNNSEYVLTGLHWVTGEYWNIWLLKTDSLGNVEWEKTYDYDNDYDIGYSVQQTSDGGFIVAGGGTIYDWISHGWIIKTDSLGDTLWTKYIEGYPDRTSPNTTFLDSYFFSIIQISNGDYVATGIEAQAPLNDQIWLVRIASDIVPVELTSFTANVNNSAVTLNWQTATETNNSGFEVQRSQNSKFKIQNDWEAIGFVAGHGTTTETQSYLFEDKNLFADVYQYRLKQIDFDGSFEYSNTVEVEINSPTVFSLEQNYPNPFNPTTKIKYTIPSTPLSFGEGLGVRLLVYDILGNEVATLVNEPQQPGTYEVEFNAGQSASGGISLSSGVYIYRITAMREGKILFNESKQMLLIK